MYNIIINPTYPGGKMLHRSEKKFGFSERPSNKSIEAIGYTASNVFKPLFIFLLQKKTIYNVKRYNVISNTLYKEMSIYCNDIFTFSFGDFIFWSDDKNIPSPRSSRGFKLTVSISAYHPPYL